MFQASGCVARIAESHSRAVRLAVVERVLSRDVEQHLPDEWTCIDLGEEARGSMLCGEVANTCRRALLIRTFHYVARPA